MSRAAYLEVVKDAELDGRWGDAMRIRIQMADEFPNPDAPKPPPDNNSDIMVDVNEWRESPFAWHAEWGEHVSLDGAATSDLTKFTADMVKRVLAKGDAGDYASAIVELNDGRWIAWESYYGDPTGSGFHADAYGGDCQIGVANAPGPCLEYLSERVRESLVWA